MPRIIPVVTELDEPPIVGKYYLVPCVQDRFSGIWLPVELPPVDGEDVGGLTALYRYDWRFVCERMQKGLRDKAQHPADQIAGPPEMQRMKCAR